MNNLILPKRAQKLICHICKKKKKLTVIPIMEKNKTKDRFICKKCEKTRLY